jgi:two-component system, NtrC family, nitrogen regulation sensor histidine kinase GlnL
MAPLSEAPGVVLMLIAPRDIAGRLTQGEPGLSGARSAIGMADMLAHEIKNPLAGIAGAAQLLSMNLETSDRELTELIVEETRRVVKLLDQVEEFGRLTPPDLQPVNIHDVLRRARRSAMLGFAAHMRVIEDYDPSLPPVLADPDQLVQVILNLLKNASEAADPAGGTIRIHSFYDIALRLRRRQPPGTPAQPEDPARARASATLPVQIEIIDDGPGIPPEIAANMFDPFVSGRENGTGLGLALVARIIAGHGAWISADSVPGRTVFRLSLPLATGGEFPQTRAEDEG